MKLAFVTATYQPNIDAIFEAAGDALAESDFDYIGSRSSAVQGKPWRDAYLRAMERLHVTPDQAIVIEDTAISLMSVKRAGLQVIATPGQITGGQNFWQADLVCDGLLDASGKLDPRVLALLA